jgi:iron complex outermembrane receptor protein
MSEITNTYVGRKDFRWQLLTTVSAIALIGFGCGVALAADDNNDRPSLWIELGGQLSQLEDGQETFGTPAIMAMRPSMFSPSQPFEGPSRTSIDEFGKISFQPENSDWVFSASIRYGRSASKKHVHQQTYPQSFATHFTISGFRSTLAYHPGAAKFADTSSLNNESHAVLDFQVGKDVGLGLFSRGGSSVFSVGVRFAQFSTRTNISIKSDPDWHFAYRTGHYTSLGIPTLRFVKSQPYHSNAANLTATRTFHGIGPSLSWSNSTPILGNGKDTKVTIDMGLNAALLFGRQKAKTHHQTTGQYARGTAAGGYDGGHAERSITFQGPATPDHTRIRTVIVPNVGGFAGLSFQIQNFKVSAGYRADLFFGAMDGGIDARKNENVGFYGPFASVSVGLGG